MTRTTRTATIRPRANDKRQQRPPTPFELLATFREQGRHDLAALLVWLLDDKAAA